MGCCDSTVSTMNGGVIKASDMLQSSITNSTFSGGSLDTVTLSNLTSIDKTSTKTIYEGFLNDLSDTQLAAFVQRLLKAIDATGSTPSSTEDNSIPTTMIGKRSVMMGAPEKWIELAGGVVPCYSK